MSVPPARIVVFCMPQQGHIQRTLPVIEALVEAGCAVHVFTGSLYATPVIQAGGHFEDLFLEGPLDAIDAMSLPRPSRYVTFAAYRATPVGRRVALLDPDLLIYDTFAVIARVISRMLDVPAINLCAGHAMVPSRMLAALAVDPRVRTDAVCLEAITVLREVYDLRDASPFSYVNGVSPHLNLYAEPRQFLEVVDRAELTPLAFFGSLRAGWANEAALVSRKIPARIRRVFVSFGSVVWSYFSARAESRLCSLARSLSGRGMELLVSLGGWSLTPATTRILADAGARVQPWVDQQAALAEADLFVTHHGLNSTHEAIAYRVPMLSCPFFSDQPALAVRCQTLGLALPLGNAASETYSQDLVLNQLRAVEQQLDGLVGRLEEAHRWEQEVIAGRPLLVERMLALA